MTIDSAFHYLLTVYVDDDRRMELVAVTVDWSETDMDSEQMERFYRETENERAWLETLPAGIYAGARLCGVQSIANVVDMRDLNRT